jgi:hypothetical protein
MMNLGSAFGQDLLVLAKEQTLQYRIRLWTKANCQNYKPECLPKPVGNFVHKSVFRPTFEKSVRDIQSFEYEGQVYKAKIYWSLKKGTPNYQIFQMELLSEDDKLLGLCSRYDTIDQLTHVPVGACATFVGTHSKVIGFSIYLPAATKASE